nr:HD domain-containing protein 2 isoform X2 [Tanacetum cinerariifolium]
MRDLKAHPQTGFRRRKRVGWKKKQDHMCKLIVGGPRAEEMHALWMEYEESSTPEAKVVKDFDKVWKQRDY